MGRRLLLVLLLLWFAGCSVETESSPPTVEKPAAKPEPARAPSGPRVDQFNLPLEIDIEGLIDQMRAERDAELLVNVLGGAG